MRKDLFKFGEGHGPRYVEDDLQGVFTERLQGRAGVGSVVFQEATMKDAERGFKGSLFVYCYQHASGSGDFRLTFRVRDISMDQVTGPKRPVKVYTFDADPEEGWPDTFYPDPTLESLAERVEEIQGIVRGSQAEITEMLAVFKRLGASFSILAGVLDNMGKGE